MFDRFTENTRKVMQMANEEALRINYEYISTEHVLLGLIKANSGKGIDVLKKFQVEPPNILLEIEKRLFDVPPSPINNRLPQAPRAKNVIRYAIEESQYLKHTHVGTAHILLGLLREQGGITAEALMHLGLDLEKVRDEVTRLADTEEK